MHHASIDDFLTNAGEDLTPGPVAVIVVEDLVAVPETLRHHLSMGFRATLVLGPPALTLPPALEDLVHRIDYDVTAEGAVPAAIDLLMAASPGSWIFYCFNAEFLFFPFCESRSVSEMIAFHTEERRDAFLTYVIDLYADDLDEHPQAVSLEEAFLDKSGYYALSRSDESNHPKERQLDFHGGLRWRFEELIPADRRKIDRISLFKAQRGLRLRANHTFNDEEYNTYACPWHNNITIALASFRTAKALKLNAGSAFEISTFRWHNSIPFQWNSQQLLDLGLMEPGQWF